MNEKDQKIIVNYYEELSKDIVDILKSKYKDLTILKLDKKILKMEKFIDVLNENWFFKSIMEMESRGYIKGYPDKTFRPNSYITREEAAQIAYKISTIAVRESDKKESEFKDIEKTRWSYEAISFLKSRDILKGREINMFFPEENLTREEAATIASRILDYREALRLENDSLYFEDHDEISSWALESIDILSRNFLIKG